MTSFRLLVFLCFLGAGGLVPAQNSGADKVEFLDGREELGTITEIRKNAREFDFTPNGSNEQKTFAYSDVHAVTFKGRRFEMTPMPAGTPPTGKPQTGTQPTGTQPTGTKNRSRAAVLEEIDKAGKTPPDWFESTAMNHPQSLDLDWPLKADGPWDESKNVGQYIWGRVNPNEARWQSGIKLVHECMARHQNNRSLLLRDMEKVGVMYFELLQDYPRAAFWLKKSGATPNKVSGIELAECYWQMGSKDLAMDALNSRSLHPGAIKLLGEMGELDSALALADRYVKAGQFVNESLLNAGDAARNAEQLDRAIKYYEKVLESPARNKEYEQRFHARALGAIEAINLYEKTDVSRIADGVYKDKSVGYNGQVEVRVTVKSSKIEEVVVTKHNEKQFYAALTDTPEKIIEKQSIRNIDGTSGATITSQAIIHATARALAQGAR